MTCTRCHAPDASRYVVATWIADPLRDGVTDTRRYTSHVLCGTCAWAVQEEGSTASLTPEPALPPGVEPEPFCRVYAAQ